MRTAGDVTVNKIDIVGMDGTVEQARPIIERATQADGVSPVSDQALLAVSQDRRRIALFYAADDAARSTPLAVGIMGQGEVDLVVDPPYRGRGVGSTALQVLTMYGPRNGLLAWAHGDNPAADTILARANFVPVRSLFRMALDPALLPGTGADPHAIALPNGYTLHTYGERPTDAADWVRANALAFADHPEQGRVTEADFALMREEPWFDASELFLLSGPEPGLVGYTWVKTVREGEQVETELYVIGVDPAHAGKGLGHALLDVTLARMAQHQPDRVTLYVDGENERAVNMYTAAGFTIDSRSRQWRQVPQ